MEIVFTTTTLELSDIAKKPHSDILYDLKKLKRNFSFKSNLKMWNISHYIDPKGQRNLMYKLTRKGFLFLMEIYSQGIENTVRMKQNLELHQTLSERAWDRLDRQDLYKTGL